MIFRGGGEIWMVEERIGLHQQCGLCWSDREKVILDITNSTPRGEG